MERHLRRCGLLRTLGDEPDGEGEREALLAQLVETLKRRLRVRFDGEPAAFEVSGPSEASLTSDA